MRIVLTFIIGFLYSFPVSQSNGKDNTIYSKELVYTYNYSIFKEGRKETGRIYLGCLGKLLPLKEQKQFAIVWTKNKRELSEKRNNTGAIEDTNRVFIHPPRNNEFRILEYSPFPYVKYPLKTNSNWNWQLTLGKYWEDEELNVLANDTLQYRYQVEAKNQEYFSFAKSLLTYYEIRSYSINPKFKSEFVGYFNDGYGFVYCQFQNIDNSTITFELVNVASFDDVLNDAVKTEENKILWDNKSWE
ncbi:hypothetical protein [Mangrovibacterium diazotrophicum]|uniref:DUF3108 domain-containing protein n=1 Tax=Mangrovibacterium diazotrophicum TaxID=1261403 RepID=A0A419VVK6_9BACT|nr:hypothetical protein [Mangrovibacterium diazotrophicum]RKD86141.1 hypothetical protein BC643_4458 [Mangrovibacterium diazotrophicum]